MVAASDNAFPSLLITEGTEPAAPAAGKQRLYIDSTSHKLKRTDSSGTDVTIEGLTTETLPVTILDAKGDLIVASSADTAAKLTVGTNGHVLTANSGAANGVEWAAPSAGTVVAALVTRNAALSVTSTPTAVTWDNEVRDDGGIWAVGQATRMVAPSTGWYVFGANISHGATNNDSLRVQLQWSVGTVIVAEGWNIESTNGFSRGISVSAMQYMTAADYIETIILGSATQALTVGAPCNMWMNKVAG